MALQPFVRFRGGKKTPPLTFIKKFLEFQKSLMENPKGMSTGCAEAIVILAYNPLTSGVSIESSSSNDGISPLLKRVRTS
jgi:hypothetical protein